MKSMNPSSLCPRVPRRAAGWPAETCHPPRTAAAASHGARARLCARKALGDNRSREHSSVAALRTPHFLVSSPEKRRLFPSPPPPPAAPPSPFFLPFACWDLLLGCSAPAGMHQAKRRLLRTHRSCKASRAPASAGACCGGVSSCCALPRRGARGGHGSDLLLHHLPNLTAIRLILLRLRQQTSEAKKRAALPGHSETDSRCAAWES